MGHYALCCQKTSNYVDNNNNIFILITKWHRYREDIDTIIYNIYNIYTILEHRKTACGFFYLIIRSISQTMPIYNHCKIYPDTFFSNYIYVVHQQNTMLIKHTVCMIWRRKIPLPPIFTPAYLWIDVWVLFSFW